MQLLGPSAGVRARLPRPRSRALRPPGATPQRTLTRPRLRPFLWPHSCVVLLWARFGRSAVGGVPLGLQLLFPYGRHLERVSRWTPRRARPRWWASAPPAMPQPQQRAASPSLPVPPPLSQAQPASPTAVAALAAVALAAVALAAAAPAAVALAAAAPAGPARLQSKTTGRKACQCRAVVCRPAALRLDRLQLARRRRLQRCHRHPRPCRRHHNRSHNRSHSCSTRRP